MAIRPSLITIHGIDGTGKTTTVEHACEYLQNQGFDVVNYDAISQKNPLSASKAEILGNTDMYTQFAFFITSTLLHSQRIKHLLQSGKTVLKARYIDDVIAHHEHLGIHDAQLTASRFPIYQPDLRVVLTLNEEERRKRIEKRGILDEKDGQLLVDGGRLSHFQSTLIRIAEKGLADNSSIFIDTGYHCPDSISEKIFTNLKSRGYYI